MLISDDCLSFLKMQIDHYRENNQCLSDAGREKYAPLKSVSALSWDETNQESVVSSAIVFSLILMPTHRHILSFIMK